MTYHFMVRRVRVQDEGRWLWNLRKNGEQSATATPECALFASAEIDGQQKRQFWASL